MKEIGKSFVLFLVLLALILAAPLGCACGNDDDDDSSKTISNDDDSTDDDDDATDDDNSADDGIDYDRNVCWVECAGWDEEDDHTFSCLITTYQSQEECEEGADEFVCGDREVVNALWMANCCANIDGAENCSECRNDCFPDWFNPDL